MNINRYRRLAARIIRMANPSFRVNILTLLEKSAIFTWHLNLIRKAIPDFSIKGKRILEIGTGFSFSMAGIWWVMGAKEIVTVDIAPLALPDYHKHIFWRNRVLSSPLSWLIGKN